MQEGVTETEEVQNTARGRGSKQAWQKNEDKEQWGEKYLGCEVRQSRVAPSFVPC